jgi:UTP:GlnB (protein PII) uridylyltransferase
MIELIVEREKYCTNRIAQLKNHLKRINELYNNDSLCIYVTGSYGRLEASKFSDLDLFFLNKDSNDFSKITKTLIDASIINICRDYNTSDFG